MVPMWTVPIALACGNAVILKPSEKCPSAAIRAAQLLKQAGLPDGIYPYIYILLEFIHIHTYTLTNINASCIFFL